MNNNDFDLVTQRGRDFAASEIQRLKDEVRRLDIELEQLSTTIRSVEEAKSAVQRQLGAWRVIATGTTGLSDDNRSSNQTGFPEPSEPPASTTLSTIGIARFGKSGNAVEDTAGAVVQLLSERDTPMHYREIYQELSSRGIDAGGKDPAKTMLARYFNDQRLQRVRRGTYAVKRGIGGEHVG